MADKTGKSTALISLTTQEEIDRPFIKIDGTDYEIQTKDDLGLKDLAELAVIGKRMTKLTDGDFNPQMAEEAAAQLRRTIPRVIRKIPAEVLKKLTDGQCLSLLNAFSGAAGFQAPKPSKDKKPEAEKETVKA